MFRLVFTASVVVAALAPPAHAEDLLQVYQLARESDPTISASDATRNATREGVAMARSAFMPQVNATLTGGRQTTDTSTTALTEDWQNNWLTDSSTHTRGNSRKAGITMDIMLFSWANISRFRGAKASAEGADYTYTAAAQDLLVRTTQAYFNVINAREQLEYARINEKFLEEQSKEANAKYRAGQILITDMLQAQTQFDTARAQVTAGRTAYDGAREGLIQIIGQDFGSLKKLRADLPLNRPDLDDEHAWVELALRQAPELHAARKTTEAANYTVQAAGANHLPTLSASLSHSFQKTWGKENAPNIPPAYGYSTARNNDTTIGLTLSIPIFSGGYTSASKQQAIFQREAAHAQLRATHRRITANTRNAYRAVISGIDQIEAREAAVLSAQGAVKAARASYQADVKTMLDVLTSQSNLFDAQVAYAQARHQFMLDGLVLRQVAGVITPQDLETINALLQ